MDKEGGDVPELKKLKSSDSNDEESEEEQIEFKGAKQQVKKETTPTKVEAVKDDGNASDSSESEKEIIIFEKNKSIKTDGLKTEAPVDKKDGEPYHPVP